MTITVKPVGGDTISETIADAQKIVARLGIGVNFSFNRVPVFIYPGSRAEEVEAMYSQGLRRSGERRENRHRIKDLHRWHRRLLRWLGIGKCDA